MTTIIEDIEVIKEFTKYLKQITSNYNNNFMEISEIADIIRNYKNKDSDLEPEYDPDDIYSKLNSNLYYQNSDNILPDQWFKRFKNNELTDDNIKRKKNKIYNNFMKNVFIY